MNLVRVDGSQALFSMKSREKDWLQFLLELYPVAPEGHLKLSHTAEPDELHEEEELLASAMAESRQGNLRLIGEFLSVLEELKPEGEEFTLALEQPQVDWLLEVLNDIRVGCWIRLGSPDVEELDKESGDKRLHAAMGIAGVFQTLLLGALEDAGW